MSIYFVKDEVDGCHVLKCISLVAGTVIRDEVGLSLDKAGNEVLGTAAKVVLTKDSTTIVGDGTTQEEVAKRVVQIKNLIEVCILLQLMSCQNESVKILLIMKVKCDFFQSEMEVKKQLVVSANIVYCEVNNEFVPCEEDIT
jgi:hypothetical protein